MLFIHKYRTVVFFLLTFFGICSVKGQNIEVLITDIRSPKGQIIIGVYKDHESFKEDKTFKRMKFPKKEIINGEMIVNFHLPPGTYGFSLLDDENDDDDMNFSFIGIPKEGFGFSDYYHTNITRPKFDVFKFTVTENQNKKVVMKIKYM